MRLTNKKIRLTSILILSAFCAGAQIPNSSQYANMAVMDINLVGGGNNINETGRLIYNIGNESSGIPGTGIISVGSVRAQISFPLQYGIQGPVGGSTAPSGLINELLNQGWSISYIETGASGTIHVINTQPIAEGNYMPLTLPVVGFTTGSGMTSITLNRTTPIVIANQATQDDTRNNTFNIVVPVPITLISFTASELSCGTIALNWVTAKEENAAHFEIEYSEDSKQFKTVTTVTSKNAAMGSSYNTVLTQNDKQGFYRLKMVDRDRSFTYSEVTKVNIECLNNNIELSPNPTTGLIRINHLSGATESILVFNAVGQKVIEQKAIPNQNQVDLTALPAGLYNLVISESGQSKATFKVVKQ